MRNRNIRIWIRVNESEYDVINNRVKKTGLSREAYIRSILLGAIPKEKPDAKFYSLMQEISTIGNNLNQIAKKANVLNFVDALEYKKEATEWKNFRMAIKRNFLEPEKIQSDNY